MKYVNQLDAHHKVYLSLGVSITFAKIFNHLPFATYSISIWIAYCVSYLLLSWLTIFSSHPKEFKKEVKAQDSGPTFLFLVTIGASLISLIGIFILLVNAGKGETGDLDAHILLSLGSVICSWIMVQTIFLLRYAHLYYAISKIPSSSATALEFPGENQPDYLDFAYFSFVIGMTFQVSDVQITSKTFRRLVLLHGLSSFIFNTVIVALSINVVSGIMQK